MTEVVYVIQNPPDLHKLFVRFSQQKSFTVISLGFSMNIYNIRVRVVSDIESLAFGWSLYTTRPRSCYK